MEVVEDIAGGTIPLPCTMACTTLHLSVNAWCNGEPVARQCSCGHTQTHQNMQKEAVAQ